MNSHRGIDSAPEHTTLTAAAALYRGELLPGYFEEWIFTERVRLAEAALRAFHQLVGLLEARGGVVTLKQITDTRQ